MLLWLKTNRLKVVSILCVMGDILMMLAGVSGLMTVGQNWADIFLASGPGTGLIGHSFIIFWGKGGAAVHPHAGGDRKPTPVLLKPFLMWRYPMDAGFALFAVGSMLVLASGLKSLNLPLILAGVVMTTASLLGWLWPQDKTLFGFKSMQVSALLYMTSAIATFLSGLWAQNLFMVLAACCYLSANLIMYTVRKENQSQYTIMNE